MAAKLRLHHLSIPKLPAHWSARAADFTEVGQSVVLGLVVSLSVRTFVAASRYIPSASMEPSLQANDFIVIDKLSYHFIAPQRGEIIDFKPTALLRTQGFRDDFVKRIIGLPGETVAVDQGIVYINGQPLPESYIAERANYTWGPEVVPNDAYWVLGDNRNQSYDSHVWGFVDHREIVGRVIFRAYPFHRIGQVMLPQYKPQSP